MADNSIISCSMVGDENTAVFDSRPENQVGQMSNNEMNYYFKRRHKAKHSIHWFRRKGLRLYDNPALRQAMMNSDTWRCVFILDPSSVGSSNQGVNKWRFLLQSLEDLDRGM